MMDFINKYKFLLAIVLPVLILIIFRSYGSNHFKPDVEKWAEPSVTGANITDRQQFTSLPGNRMIIVLDDHSGHSLIKEEETFYISPDSIIQKTNLKRIRKNDGPILLVSSESSTSARIWMILSQMGIRNLYILGEPEDLKHEFRPDTLARPESLSF